MAEKTFHSLTLPGQDTARVPLTAAEFSTSVAYKVKDYCTYQGKLYRCTVAHAAGTWNASHFVETDMDAELDRKLDIPPSQASAPANPRVGDLWIDNDENSPVYNVDAAPTLGSANAVQSGGTKTALNAIDSRKVEHGCITGDFSASVDYRVGDLVFYATTANGITTRTLYRCTTAHNAAAWKAAHFTATTLEVELQRVRDNEANTNMISNLFGARSTYAVGDYCIYNGNLYRCIQAVDNTGVTTPAFDPDDWIQVALANDVSDLKSALGESAGSDIDIVTASNSGTGTTYWVNLPVNVVNKVKEKHVLLMKLLSATGLGSGASRIADTYIYYTDGTNTTKAFTTIDGKYYSVPINTEKTINTISIRITRGTVSEKTNTDVTFSIIYSEDYVQFALSDLRTQDEALNDEINSLRVFDESNLAQNVLYNRTEKSIGKGDTFWVSNADAPSTTSKKDIYLYIYSYSGDSIPTSATDLVRLIPYYTDGTSANYNFSELKTWKKITLDANKTLDHFGLRFRRSSASLSVNEETSYTVIITDTQPTKVQNEEINSRLDFVETEPITDAIVNTDNIVFSNINDQFTATSSATWQGTLTVDKYAVVPDGITSITYVWDDANVYGTAALYLYCYSDENYTDLIRTWATGYETINTLKSRTVALSDGTKSIRLQARLFSSSYGSHVPQAGDVAFFKNLRAYFGELALREDLVVPQVNNLDQSTIFVLRDDWKNRIPEIQELQKENFTFGIQTDTHFGEIGTGIYKDQYNDLMVNLSKLTEYVGFNFIANLGDIVRGYGGDTTVKMKEAYTELMHRYVSHLHCPFFIVPGNHDTNVMYAEEEQDPTLQITKAEMYAKLIPFVKNSAPDIVQDGKSLYYYKDFDEYGIRLIMLNSTDGNYTDPSEIGSVFVISQKQVEWFRTVALATDNAIIVCCHVPLVSGLTTNTVSHSADVMNAIYTFKDNGGKVIGCFYGHTHNQTSVIDENGIVHITFTQGGYCAEVVVVDLDNDSINTIGLGKDGRGIAVTDRVFSIT